MFINNYIDKNNVYKQLYRHKTMFINNYIDKKNVYKQLYRQKQCL